MNDNPLVADGSRPAFSAIRAEHVLPALQYAIAQHRAAMSQLAARSGAGRADYRFKEIADARLGHAWSPVAHLKAVAETPALRAAYEEGQPHLIAYQNEIAQDLRLYNVVAGIGDFDQDLDPIERRAIDLAARKFLLSGVNLEETERLRLAAIRRELSILSTGFSNAVRDTTEAWTRVLTEDELAGVPTAERAMLANNARLRGMTGWLATLAGPSIQAIMGHADDRGLREAVHRAANTRASDQWPDAGGNDNSERIVSILELRAEAATLLGFEDSVALSLHLKMARDADTVEAFLLDLADRVRPAAQAEYAALAAHAASLGIASMEPWDVSYVAEKLRLARHAVDDSTLRAYFPLDAVLGGLVAILSDLFGIELREEADVDAWHSTVRYFSVSQGERVIGGIYLDLHARPGKISGAWMANCRARIVEPGSEQLPLVHLVSNFSPADGQAQTTLTHGEVVTLFHEMGHSLHQLLSEVDLPSIAGINGVEWDAVELPSQLLENFAWDRRALNLVTRHVVHGEAMPDDLIEKLLGARHFLAGLAVLRQVELGLIDLRLHRAVALDRDGVLAVIAAVRDEVAVIRQPDWSRPAHSFLHIFAGGYAAGYYSYLWAERLSSDAYARFADAGTIDRATGMSFREQVLGVGGSRPAMESFVAFRGRDADSAALLRTRGLAPDPLIIEGE